MFSVFLYCSLPGARIHSLFYCCVCIRRTHTYYGLSVEVTDTFVELVLSFHLCAISGDQTQVPRLVQQHCLPTEPSCLSYFLVYSEVRFIKEKQEISPKSQACSIDCTA